MKYLWCEMKNLRIFRNWPGIVKIWFNFNQVWLKNIKFKENFDYLEKNCCKSLKYRYNAPVFSAGITQLVECNLAKVDVASSSLVSRSKFGALAKRLCSGLQIRLVQSDSGTRLHQMCQCPSGEIGRHKGFKIPRNLYFRASSILASGTILKIIHNFISSSYSHFHCWIFSVFPHEHAVIPD